MLTKIYAIAILLTKVARASNNIIWCYPGVSYANNDNCVIVLPEIYPMKPWRSAYGICSDYVANYRKEFEV